jgi:hypothetical protein
MAMHNVLLHVSFQNNNKDDKNGLLVYSPLQNQSKEILLVNLFNDGFIGEIVNIWNADDDHLFINYSS